MIRQRLYGLVLIVLGVLVPLIDKDATGSLILMPMGIVLLFSKERWVH